MPAKKAAKKKPPKKRSVDVTKHYLVPKHTKLSDKEKKDLLEKYYITVKELPRIVKTDPAIQGLNPQIGDVIKIVRPSATAKETLFYRGVVRE